MSIFRCAACDKLKDSDRTVLHPVSRNKAVCNKCFENSEETQADVARYEDQCDDDNGNWIHDTDMESK